MQQQLFQLSFLSRAQIIASPKHIYMQSSIYLLYTYQRSNRATQGPGDQLLIRLQGQQVILAAQLVALGGDDAEAKDAMFGNVQHPCVTVNCIGFFVVQEFASQSDWARDVSTWKSQMFSMDSVKTGNHCLRAAMVWQSLQLSHLWLSDRHQQRLDRIPRGAEEPNWHLRIPHMPCLSLFHVLRLCVNVKRYQNRPIKMGQL